MALILVNGLFAGAEIAVVSVRRTRIAQLVDEGRGGARALAALRAGPESMLATIQVGITVVSVAASAIGGAQIADRIAPRIGAWSPLAPYAEQVALAVVVVVISYLSIVIGELVPKSLALRASETYAVLVSRPLVGLALLAKPAVWFLTSTTNLVLRVFDDRTSFMESRLSPEEILQHIQEAAKAGSLHARAGEIAERAIEFGDVTAADVMVPRNRIVAVARDAGERDLRAAFDQRIHTRLPVYEETLDEIVGYVSSKDVLVSALRGRLPPVEDLIRPVTFIPEPMRAVDALQELQKKRAHLAIVVDERGGTAGLLTIEDLVEELVGEIVGEHEADAPGPIRRRADGTAVVLGTVPVHEANRELDLDLPESEHYSTVAGLCIANAGRIPEAGESLRLDDGTVIEILEASPRRVRTLRIHPPPKEEPPTEPPAPADGEGGGGV